MSIWLFFSPSSEFILWTMKSRQDVHGCRYLDIVRKHGLEILQPGLDATEGAAPMYDITARKNGSDMHK
jgi:hypothetical protein